MERRRPKVGIIYSTTASEKESNESSNLAHYYCANLVRSGHCTVSMVGMQKDGSLPMNLSQNFRLSYYPPTARKPVEVATTDIQFAHWDAVESCHVIIVCVNSTDTETCVEKLKDVLQNHQGVVVFGMQRGVRNSGLLKDGMHGLRGVVMLECIVSFAVVKHPKTGAYISTSPRGVMVCERLAKEIEKKAIGPLNLMEYMEVDFQYRKVLTPHAWGTIMYENIFALNAISGGSINDTLKDATCRSICAAMIRENYKGLERAARFGAWKPAFEMFSYLGTPWVLEMMLQLPYPLYSLVAALIGMPSFVDGLSSPGLQDLSEGRTTQTTANLLELVKAAKRNSFETPVCEAVHDKLARMEETSGSGSLSNNRAGSKENLSDLVVSLQATKGNKSHYAAYSHKEFNVLALRLVAMTSTLLLVFYLFFHDVD